MKTILRVNLILLTVFLWASCGSAPESVDKGANPPAVDVLPEPVVDPVVIAPEPTVVAPPPVEEPEEPIEKEEETAGEEPDPSGGVKPSPTVTKPSKSNRIYRMPSFPFPPPKASASHTFEENVFAKADNLYEVSELIEGALKKSGYYEKSYYKVPNGFALVTRMEKMKPDGSPATEDERWNINPDKKGGSFSLMSYFKSLFIAEDGNYRIIVFLITSENLRQTEETMSMKEAKQYLTKGYNRLPNDFKNIPFTDAYSCSALIYEWYKVEHEDPVFMEPSKFLGQYHLAKNKFVEYIGEE